MGTKRKDDPVVEAIQPASDEELFLGLLRRRGTASRTVTGGRVKVSVTLDVRPSTAPVRLTRRLRVNPDYKLPCD